jgi:predicted TIM-barrel fold metal-dependent hydrolase
MKDLPKGTIEDCLNSGRIFLAPEAEDRWLLHEIALVGDEHVLYASDFPHGEEREEAAMRFLERKELTKDQKEKIFYRNATKLFGEP